MASSLSLPSINKKHVQGVRGVLTCPQQSELETGEGGGKGQGAVSTARECGVQHTVAVSQFKGQHPSRTQSSPPAKAGSFRETCRPRQLLLNGTVYSSKHFLVASPDVPAPTSTSLFMQPRSGKVTRRVKFDCQICLSYRNS